MFLIVSCTYKAIDLVHLYSTNYLYLTIEPEQLTILSQLAVKWFSSRHVARDPSLHVIVLEVACCCSYPAEVEG